MNVLVVVSGAPRPLYGAGARNYHLLRALAASHSVSLLALLDPAETIPFSPRDLESVAAPIRVLDLPDARLKRARQLASMLTGTSYALTASAPAQAQSALDELLRACAIDVVLFEGVGVAGYRTPSHVGMVIDQHNIEYELAERSAQQAPTRLRRFYGALEARRLRRGEIERCQRADAITVCSERERVALTTILPGKLIAVAPNGADMAAFPLADSADETPGRVTFTGTMHYQPNAQAALLFARACWPRIRAQEPTATWHIVGAGAPAEVQALGKLAGVTVVGWTPEMRPHLAASAVVVAPLLVGGGTRLKILEAFSTGKAVVSTSLGCEGINAVPGQHLLVEDDMERFADAVVALLRDPQRRHALGVQASALVQENYTWESSGRQLAQTLEQVVARKQREQRPRPA